MNNELLYLVWLSRIPIDRIYCRSDRDVHYSNSANFTAGILCARSENELENYCVASQAFTWFGVVLVVFDLLPADPCSVDEIAFEVLVRDATVFFQKRIDGLRKILVGLADCWIESKQFHPKRISLVSEMSLYQFKDCCLWTNLNLCEP